MNSSAKRRSAELLQDKHAYNSLWMENSEVGRESNPV